jgi:hypothetical protein
MEYVTLKIIQAVANKMEPYYNTGNLQVLLRTKPTHFFEIKSHLETSCVIPQPSYHNMIPKNVLLEVRKILLQNLKVILISELSEAQQVCTTVYSYYNIYLFLRLN